MAGIYYDKRFYRHNKKTTASSAREVMGYVIERLKPQSIVDFGCGSGQWLGEAYRKGGRTRILGIDGSWVDKSVLAFPAEFFIEKDLSKKIELGERFDLAVSLEVAEHIGESAADTFISNLCRHADVVLFSAAFPLMGGTGHVNEQYPSYWAKKFSMHGYRVLDCLRGRFWNNPRVIACYKNDMMFYIKEERYEAVAELFGEAEPILDIVHPEEFEAARDVDRLINRAYLMEHLPQDFFYWLKRVYLVLNPKG